MARRIAEYEHRLCERKTKEVHFPIIISDDVTDMSRIYPTKQQEVKRVLDLLRLDERVDEVHLFGSSITMACCSQSDTDFAVRLKCEDQNARNDVSEKIQQACNWKADILWLDHIESDERIYKEIMGGLVLI